LWPSCGKNCTLYPLKLLGYWTIVHQILHDVAALSPLLTCALTYRNIAVRFGTPEQTVKVVNFHVCESPQNYLVIMAMSTGDSETYVSLIIARHMSINGENLVMISPVFFQIFGDIHPFAYCPKSDKIVTLYLRGY